MKQENWDAMIALRTMRRKEYFRMRYQEGLSRESAVDFLVRGGICEEEANKVADAVEGSQRSAEEGDPDV